MKWFPWNCSQATQDFLLMLRQQNWPLVFQKRDTLWNQSAVKNEQIRWVYLSIFVLGDSAFLSSKSVGLCTC